MSFTTADAPQEGDEPKEERVDTAEEGADNATKGSEEGDTTTDEITAPPEGDQESTVAVTGDEKETGTIVNRNKSFLFIYFSMNIYESRTSWSKVLCQFI